MSKSSQYQSTRDFTRTVTIAVGQTQSDPIDTNGCSIVGIRTDSNLTGVKLTFQSAESYSGDYLPYYSNDKATPPLEKEIELTVSPSRHYGFGDKDFTSTQFIKVTSGTVQATTDSVLTLVLRP